MGNLIWAGEYDQCVSINEAKWSGKYCYYQKYDGLKKFIFVNIFLIFALIKKSLNVFELFQCLKTLKIKADEGFYFKIPIDSFQKNGNDLLKLLFEHCS